MKRGGKEEPSAGAGGAGGPPTAPADVAVPKPKSMDARGNLGHTPCHGSPGSKTQPKDLRLAPLAKEGCQRLGSSIPPAALTSYAFLSAHKPLRLKNQAGRHCRKAEPPLASQITTLCPGNATPPRLGRSQPASLSWKPCESPAPPVTPGTCNVGFPG